MGFVRTERQTRYETRGSRWSGAAVAAIALARRGLALGLSLLVLSRRAADILDLVEAAVFVAARGHESEPASALRARGRGQGPRRPAASMRALRFQVAWFSGGSSDFRGLDMRFGRPALR